MAHLKIISRNMNAFANRREAGMLLGAELLEFQGENALVLGIPRGGVVVAQQVADALEAELDIVLSRKLRAPGNPEFAIGAVGETGKVYINEDLGPYYRIDNDYLDAERAFQMAEISRRSVMFRRALPKVSQKDRVVIIVDDGIATGSTMQAAIWTAHEEGAARIIAAVPVGPPDTLERLAESADEAICLHMPSYFSAVGQFYDTFEQTTDEEVMSILKKEAEKHQAAERRRK